MLVLSAVPWTQPKRSCLQRSGDTGSKGPRCYSFNGLDNGTPQREQWPVAQPGAVFFAAAFFVTTFSPLCLLPTA